MQNSKFLSYLLLLLSSVFCLLSFPAHCQFNPFSLTNEKEITYEEEVYSPETKTTQEKSAFSEEIEFKEEKIEKEDFTSYLEKLEKEREALLSKEEIKEEPTIEFKEEILIEEPKEEVEEKEDIKLLAEMASNRLKEAEDRRKRLILPKEEYERLKTQPGEALKWNLPEESSLNVLGRKFIKMGYSGKSLLNTTEKEKSSNQINIDQELEVKIKGIVKKKVSVNVDYSDKSTDVLPAKKTFEVKYAGDKEEVIQEATFGDVALKLPASKFVGYEKSGFGISAKAQTLKNKLNISAIASREKGESRSKSFKGTTTLGSSDMQDTSFIRRRFYQVLGSIDMEGDKVDKGRIEWLKSKGYLPIKPGSFMVYIDDKDPNNNTSAIPLTGFTYEKSGSYTGYFDQKFPGEDYSFDYWTGILSFKYAISENYVVLVSFINGLGSSTTNLIIKNEKAEEIKNPGVYELFEIKGYYSLFYRKINPEAADFSFEIRDTGGRYWYDANNNGLFDTGELTYVRIFGLDRDKRYDQEGKERLEYNKIDKDVFDLDLGLLKFPDRIPFDFTTSTTKEKNRFYYEDSWYLENIFSILQPATLSLLSNQNCYKQENPQSKYTIRITYFAEKFGFSLDELNIVPESEAIYINGNRLSKSEYSIDYEVGYITIYRKIKAEDDIKVDYEYAPFLGVYQKSLLGTRIEYKPGANFSLGGTYIGESGAGLKGAPSVTHPSTSLSVFDITSSLSLTELLKEKMNYNGPLSLKFEGEFAHCIQNPNTYGYGIVDSMDNTENEVSGGITETSWQISSLLSGEVQTPRGKIFYYEDGKQIPYTERCGPYVEDGGHRLDEEQNKQKMLTFNLSLGTSSPERFVGLATFLSKEGIDLSDYSFIEVWSDIPSSSTIKFYLDIGNVSEDSDGDGILDTEDIIYKDGILNPGEDIGFPFSTETRCGAKNGKLDSEDLDGDGSLETGESIFTVLVNDERYIQDTKNTVSGWRLYKIPIKDPGIGLRVVKHMRIRFKNAGTASILNTAFHIDRIAIIGSNWEKPVLTKGTGTISLLGRNSKNDADYVSLINDPEYKKLHEKEELKEEGALSISYNFATFSSAYIRKPLGRIQNYNSYKSLRFWVYGYSGTQSLSLRFGQDASNCFEYNVGTISKGWSLISINLSIFNELLAKKGTQNGNFVIIGSPNMGRINEIRFILNASSEGEIWLNEIHLSDVVKREADSYFVSLSGGWTNWGNFNFNRTNQEGEFRTIGPVASGQETDSIHFDTSITRFSVFPLLKFVYDKKKNDLSYKNVDEVSTQKFGIDETSDKKFDISFDLNKKKNKGFPVLSSYYKKNEFLYSYSDNNNEGMNSEIGGDLSHSYTFPKKIKSPSLSTTYSFTKQDGSLTDYLNKTNSNEKEKTSHSGKTSLSFSPHPSLSGSNISLEKQISNEDIEYPGRQGTGTLEKNDKDLSLASLLLKFYPKGPIPIPKILPKSSYSTEYSISKSIEDLKTSYEGISGSKTLQETEKDNVKDGIIVSIFPYKTFPLETNYSITQNREMQDSNLSQYIYETKSRNQSTYVLHRDNKGSITIEGNKLSFGQNEAKAKEDKALLLTHREIKYDLNRVEIGKLRFIPLISSTRIDKKFYFLEDYDISTDRRIYKKRASTSSHLGINNSLGEIKWKKYGVGLSTTFTLDANAGYDNLDQNEETLKTLLSVYNDFHKGLLFKRKGPNGDLYSKAKRTSSSDTRAFGITGIWKLYEPLTTESKITLTLEEKENGILWSDTISNSINNTLDLMKAKPGLSKRFNSSSLKANYKIDWSHQYTNIAERSISITHNPYFEWNADWKNNLKTTSILKTTFSNSKEASGIITKNLEVYPSLSGTYDYTKPGFLNIPFIKKAISLERKLSLTGKIDTSFKRKTKGKIQEINEDDYKFDVSGTYKIQENTSGTLGLNLSYFKDRVKAGRDYLGYGSYVSLEFRF
ncbi:MAG: carbohydrate binding domain-containing protein [bacterium]